MESQKHIFFQVIMGKNRNDQLFGKILFLPVMTQKMVKTKEHCSPTRSKAVFVQHFC